MARFKVSPNLEKYEKKLSQLGDKARPMIEKAVKEGANPMADAARAAIEALPTDERIIRPGSGEVKAGPTQYQKNALLSGFGIAPIRDDGGFINVKLGFDGYSNIVTDAWPKGQPIPMIANAVEAGTWFMASNPFMNQTVRAQRQKTIKTMQDVIDEEISKWFGG